LLLPASSVLSNDGFFISNALRYFPDYPFPPTIYKKSYGADKLKKYQLARLKFASGIKTYLLAQH